MTLADVPDLPWMRQAECRGADPEVFYPEKGHPVARAKAICAECPVQAPCLDYALARPERFGVWGGLSERERTRLLRDRRRQARYDEEKAA